MTAEFLSFPAPGGVETHFRRATPGGFGFFGVRFGVYGFFCSATPPFLFLFWLRDPRPFRGGWIVIATLQLPDGVGGSTGCGSNLKDSTRDPLSRRGIGSATPVDSGSTSGGVAERKWGGRVSNPLFKTLTPVGVHSLRGAQIGRGDIAIMITSCLAASYCESGSSEVL